MRCRWMKRIVFVRTAGVEQKLPAPCAVVPWIADASTGNGRYWRSGDKPEDSLPELTEDEPSTRPPRISSVCIGEGRP
jgi:hypothetical protein